MQNLNSTQWANMIFGQADLGDPRRTRRLTQLASDLSNSVGTSIVKACDSPASVEAAYRFIRNENIIPEDIAESGFMHTCELLQHRPLVLAIQDTTELTFKHGVSEKLGNVSNSKTNTSKKRSLHVHSTLIIDADTEQTVGLANQKYWFRQEKNKEKQHQLQKRKFEERETSIWMKCFESLKGRVSNVNNVLDVCDRGADIYEYLDYHNTHNHRFLVRAKGNRRLIEPQGNLRQICETAPGQSCYTVEVKQKGARKARLARMVLHYQKITLAKPRYAEGQNELTVNVVICREKDTTEDEALCWTLYTSEPINSAADAQKLVRYYELRWRIEEFHKVWKSDGTDVEGLRLQTVENIKRLAIIQAFIAIRLQQLQEWAQNRKEAQLIECTCHVKELTWKMLWLKVEKGKAFPLETPSLYWLYYAISKLGGWYDSKRNGRVGVKALWRGWSKLSEMVETAEMLKKI